jgi:GR25 family glycosyltransferase involved in LPS biosynthesis
MEYLQAYKEINWTVVDALDPSDIAIGHIFDRIVSQRSPQPSRGHRDDFGSNFRWPADINAIATSTEYLGASGSDLWTSTNTQDSRHTTSSSISVSPHPNITCATQDYSVPSFKPSLPDWMILTAPKISCWYSHVSAVRKFINRVNTTPEDVAVFLEDDIDMEKDIEMRMRHVWPSLPHGWDMVFLGKHWCYFVHN